MAIEDIFRALEDQADAECKEILDGAKAQADAILRDAEVEAQEIKDRRVVDAEAVARTKSTHALNSVRLANKKDIAALKGRAIDQVFESALAELSGLRGTSDYAALFGGLADEVMGSADGEITVLVDPADRDLASSVLSQSGVSAPVETSLSTSGGLVVTSDEGRIARRNTLEDRLDKIRYAAMSEVARILFD